MLELLLPSFAPVARALGPLTRWIARGVARQRGATAPAPAPAEAAEEAERGGQGVRRHRPSRKGSIEGEERRLLQSIVDFGDTLVREVMTPRPDIVAIREDATIGELRALFREQEYSRFPVYKDSLDNIAGLRLRQGPRRARTPATTRGRSRRSCGRPSSCRRPSACPSC